MLDVLVSKVILQRSGIVAGVCEGVTAGVAEHVCVGLEGQAGFLPSALHEPVERIGCEWTAPLRHKDKRRFRCLASQLAEGTQLITADQVRSRLAIFGAAHMQRSGGEIDL